MWSGIWSVATTKIVIWTWIWSIRHWTGEKTGLLISVLEKLNWFCFDVKMDGSIHVERSSFKMLGLAFSSKLDWFIAKATSKEIGAMIHSMKFICLYKSTLRPCMENCCLRLGWCLLLLLGIFISYKSGSAGRLVLYLLPLLNPCLIFEM